jgi:hypothetical protein
VHSADLDWLIYRDEYRELPRPPERRAGRRAAPGEKFTLREERMIRRAPVRRRQSARYIGGRDDRSGQTSAAVTAKPAPDSAAAIEARVRGDGVGDQSQRQPGLRQPPQRRDRPSNGFHGTIRTAAEVKKHV